MKTIGILVFDDVEELDFVAPLEVFGMAARHGADCRTLLIAEERRDIRCRYGMRVAPEFAIDEAPAQRGMGVLPDWLGRGVARQMLLAAEDELRAQKCNRVTLDTTDPLQRAMRFYEKHGYRRTGRVGDFFGMPLHEYAKKL